jgi:PAS domain S-box-containing protein
MLDMIDYDYADISARNLSEMVVEPKEFKQLLKKLRIRNELRNVAIQLRARNKETRHLNMHMSISWQSGTPMIKCYCYDVTEKKNEAAALRERNRTLHLLNSVGTKILSELNPVNLVKHVISSAVNIVGADAGLFLYPSPDGQGTEMACIGDSFRGQYLMDLNEFVHEEDSVRITDLSQQKEYRKVLSRLGFENVRDLNSFMYVPLHDRQSKVIGGFYFVHESPEVFTELSEILINGISLQASIGLENARLFEQKKVDEERFRLLIESIPQMVWTATELGEIDYCNKRWEEYTGLTCPETSGAGWLQVIHHDDIVKVLRSWKEALKLGRPYEVEYRIRKSTENTHRWNLVRALPIKDKTGTIIKWFGTCTDIEEQKQKNQRKDDFISMASHELKTPLTSIKGYVQLLEKTLNDHADSPAIAKMFASKTNIQIDKLNTLIGDLLDVSRIQTGNLQYQMHDFELGNMINDVMESHMAGITTHQVEVKNELSGTWVGDKGRIEQVINNLVNNAVKYSPNGKKVIVEATQDDANIQISVLDFGLGIPQDQLDRVFERFYRVDNKKSFIPGLGIGLYICAEIVKKHHGKLWAESEMGKYTRFFISLPRKHE